MTDGHEKNSDSQQRGKVVDRLKEEAKAHEAENPEAETDAREYARWVLGFQRFADLYEMLGTTNPKRRDDLVEPLADLVRLGYTIDHQAGCWSRIDLKDPSDDDRVEKRYVAYGQEHAVGDPDDPNWQAIREITFQGVEVYQAVVHGLTLTDAMDVAELLPRPVTPDGSCADATGKSLTDVQRKLAESPEPRPWP